MIPTTPPTTPPLSNPTDIHAQRNVRKDERVKEVARGAEGPRRGSNGGFVYPVLATSSGTENGKVTFDTKQQYYENRKAEEARMKALTEKVMELSLELVRRENHVKVLRDAKSEALRQLETERTYLQQSEEANGVLEKRISELERLLREVDERAAKLELDLKLALEENEKLKGEIDRLQTIISELEASRTASVHEEERSRSSLPPEVSAATSSSKEEHAITREMRFEIVLPSGEIEMLRVEFQDDSQEEEEEEEENEAKVAATAERKRDKLAMWQAEIRKLGENFATSRGLGRRARDKLLKEMLSDIE